MHAGRLLHHRPHGAVFLLREPDSFLDCGGIYFVTYDHMVDTDRGKNLWWPLRLFSFDSDFVACYLLVILLTKNCNDVEGCAPG